MQGRGHGMELPEEALTRGCHPSSQPVMSLTPSVTPKAHAGVIQESDRSGGVVTGVTALSCLCPRDFKSEEYKDAKWTEGERLIG